MSSDVPDWLPPPRRLVLVVQLEAHGLEARFWVVCCGQNTPPLPPQLRTLLPSREKVFTCRLAPAVTPGLRALQICHL
jgi:hypothetical protein